MPNSTTTPPTGSRYTLDQAFDALSRLTRRRILLTLDHHNPRDETEFETTEFKPEDEDLDLFRQNLYHRHLPKLADAGFITWDRETDTITRGPRFAEIQPLLSLLKNHPDELPEDWP